MTLLTPLNKNINDKVAIVTGSTSGIGRGIALMLGNLGAKVVLNSTTSVEAGISMTKEIKDSIYIQGDISKPQDVEKIINDTLDHFGGIDILVNNAGITRLIDHKDIEGASVDVWKSIFEVNVFGTWDMILKTYKHLEESSSGVIINVSSIAGLRPTGSSIPYATSKAAVVHMTKLLAKALGPKVRVNAVAPGLIETPWTQDWDFAKQIVSQQAPLKRPGTPEDVAEIVVGLINSKYLTGEVVLVDGGWNLS